MASAQTTQTAWESRGDYFNAIKLPSPEIEVVPGVFWGKVEDLLSPAFWKYQAFARRTTARNHDYRLGRSLLEEVGVCLLGGYGMPAELGLAAFNRLRSLDLLTGYASQADIEAALTEPFEMNGRFRRYRFARQKSRYLASSLNKIRHAILPSCEKQCRDYLTTLDGIGPKTASWIVRNHYSSDAVAILDIHIIRAGIVVGLFEPTANPSRRYFDLEDRFLEFCRGLGEPASLVDALMWDFMRRIGPTTSLAIGRNKTKRLTSEHP